MARAAIMSKCVSGFQDKHDEEPYFTPGDSADCGEDGGTSTGSCVPRARRPHLRQSNVPIAERGTRRPAGEQSRHGGPGRAGAHRRSSWGARWFRLPGAPVAAGRMENLIALGVRRFVSLGSAGGLQPDLDVGDLVVCTGAVRDEGVSYHYLADHVEVSPDPTLTAALSAELHGPIRAGRTWTIDAPYRETVAEVHHYRADGVPDRRDGGGCSLCSGSRSGRGDCQRLLYRRPPPPPRVAS